MPATAPPVTLIDLDDAAPLDRKVRLGGREWKIPGDAPTGWLLQFRQLETGEAGDDFDMVERVRDLIVDLFLIRQPDAEQELVAAIDEKGIGSLLPMVGRLYGDPETDVQEAPANGARPTRAAGGTRSTKPAASRSPSRSSRSSAS